MALDLSGFADALGISIGTAVMTLIALGFVIFFFYKNIKNTEKRTKFIIGAILMVLVFIGFTGGFLSPSEKGLTLNEEDIDGEYQTQAWQIEYDLLASISLSDYEGKIANTDYYDYEDIVITAAANKIARESKSSEEAIKKTLAFVENNMDYVTGEPNDKCFNGNAPDIFASGKGQCDTESIVVISILRRMGIAAKPVGGCIIENDACKLQAFFQSIAGFKAPIYTELAAEDFIEEKEIFGRGVETDRADAARLGGGLHAWVTAWDPEEGWLDLEATNGKIANHKCYYYHVELFPEDNDKKHICASSNEEYAKACGLQLFSILDKEGIGLATEVNPK